MATTEEALTKLKDKCDKIQIIKCIDVSVKRLPSNWRAAMLKIAREKARKEFKETVDSSNTDGQTNDDNKESVEDNKTDEEKVDDKTEGLNQFQDLFQLIY